MRKKGSSSSSCLNVRSQPINISMPTLASWFSQHTSASTCCRVLLTGILQTSSDKSLGWAFLCPSFSDVCIIHPFWLHTSFGLLVTAPGYLHSLFPFPHLPPPHMTQFRVMFSLDASRCLWRCSPSHLQ